MKYNLIASLSVIGSVIMSCNHNFDRIPVHENPRSEYAPNMYVSEAYEPFTLVDDSAAYPEEYNVMPYNNGMNMRMPVPGTIKRGYTPYSVSKDSLEWANANVKSPLDTTEQILAEGEVLYVRFCAHCHGETGEGDGPVSTKLAGIANLKSSSLKLVTAGHVYHVITHGKGRMLQHGSQIESSDRWKIALYVKNVLQK
ncbi:MAG: cytochrome c [Cytophagaceae bacterium]|jgi:mono/diheme cytochrome c family protein|nr:cytochrome c [Cytophagaceae bacterium]